MLHRLVIDDCRKALAKEPDQSVQCVVTSPPYWGLRDYKLEPSVWGGDEGCEHEWGGEQITASMSQQTAYKTGRAGGEPRAPAKKLREEGKVVGQGCWCHSCGAWRGCLGLEPTPDLYVQHLVSIFREVRRVLRDDGTVWLNLGDSYASQGGPEPAQTKWQVEGASKTMSGGKSRSVSPGLKPKDLIGIPWRVAFALQADGWYLRSDIIWAKGYSFHPTTAGSCMPESVTDRPTRGHEFLFLLSKGPKYYYDHEAVKEQGIFPAGTRAAKGSGTREGNRRGGLGHQKNAQRDDGNHPWDGYATYSGTRNLRSVWLINPKPFKEAHFATFPPALVEPCIKAGSKLGDVVLDPFAGSGTIALVAEQLRRNSLNCEPNPEYAALAFNRLLNLDIEMQVEGV